MKTADKEPTCLKSYSADTVSSPLIKPPIPMWLCAKPARFPEMLADVDCEQKRPTPFSFDELAADFTLALPIVSCSKRIRDAYCVCSTAGVGSGLHLGRITRLDHQKLVDPIAAVKNANVKNLAPRAASVLCTGRDSLG
jgi:hypothetical protein